MSRALKLLLIAALLAPVAARAASEDEAGDTSEADKDSAGPLRDRVRPVSGQVFLMKGRFEMSPGFSLSLKDAFYTKVAPLIALTYHFNDAFGLSLRGGYNISFVAGAAQICTKDSAGMSLGCNSPSMKQLTDASAFGQMSIMAGLELQWSPIYGKLGLVAEKFLEFNMYLGLGPTFVMYGPANTPTAGGNVGIGFRFFINKFLTARLELRDVIYDETFGTGIGKTESFRNQLMAEVGFSIFLPTAFEGG
jgi:outer membrane beta-barrel protein